MALLDIFGVSNSFVLVHFETLKRAHSFCLLSRDTQEVFGVSLEADLYFLKPLSNAYMLQEKENLRVAHGVAKLTKHRAAAQARCQGAQPGCPSGNPIIWHV